LDLREGYAIGEYNELLPEQKRKSEEEQWNTSISINVVE
jgi:hypothetical protein